MNALVSSGFSDYQDTLQTGSIIKLYIVINIDIDQYGKNYHDQILLPYHPALIPSYTVVQFHEFLIPN